MELKLILLFILAAILISEIQSAEHKERKHKYRKHKKWSPPAALSSNLDEEGPQGISDEEEALKVAEDLAKQQERERERETSEADDSDVTDDKTPLIDPCSKVHCGAGRVCQLDENEDPLCVCIPECPEETEERRKVCSNYNETWPSDCSIYQQRCWCSTNDKKCKEEKYRHIHIEYYGVCRDMPECKKEEMDDFPRRMRDWLFNVMRDLADRQELTPHYYKMEKEAENNLTRRWVNAAIWKWCDLDMSHDRTVSRHELFPIRAPLMSLEHCMAPFLDSCDTDNNHKITLKEWGKCLNIDEDELEDRCDEIEENNNKNNDNKINELV
ncbi:SPARC [Agrilus planipennis]|uniref:SPARC n=1 Tax=Agrilus planipennis TaxID=224129 RepID=A0A7F5RMP9_AGRPL|nr:SPARC [Agrilus planipennis]